MNHTALVLAILFIRVASFAAEPLRLATFDVDATPPLGSAMAYDPVKILVEVFRYFTRLVNLAVGKFFL